MKEKKPIRRYIRSLPRKRKNAHNKNSKEEWALVERKTKKMISQKRKLDYEDKQKPHTLKRY